MIPEPIELLDLVSLKITGPAVLFIKVAPEHMTPEYLASISQATSHVLKFLRPQGIQFLVVPKDIDLAVLGEGELKQIGYARIPEPTAVSDFESPAR